MIILSDVRLMCLLLAQAMRSCGRFFLVWYVHSETSLFFLLLFICSRCIHVLYIGDVCSPLFIVFD